MAKNRWFLVTVIPEWITQVRKARQREKKWWGTTYYNQEEAYKICDIANSENGKWKIKSKTATK